MPGLRPAHQFRPRITMNHCRSPAASIRKVGPEHRDDAGTSAARAQSRPRAHKEPLQRGGEATRRHDGDECRFQITRQRPARTIDSLVRPVNMRIR